MLSHLEPYLLAPSALTPTALLQRAHDLLSDPAVAAALASGERAVLVRSNPLYDAWLVRWSADDATDLHSHADSYGAYAVVAGEFREVAAAEDGLRERIVARGERVGFQPGYAHRLSPAATDSAGTGDAGIGDAVTLHLSSPPRAAAPCLVPAGAVAAVA